MIRHTEHFRFKLAEHAEQVANHARNRDGAIVEQVGPLLYVEDKFTFDHIVYHYVLKIAPAQRPTTEKT